jgi:hypothetical protein
MPSYNVLLKDGTSATVEAPPNATKQQLAEAINRQKRSYYSTETFEEARARRAEKLARLQEEARQASERFRETQRGSFTRGLDIGTDLVGQATGSALEGIGSLLGLEGLEEYGAEVALENEADAQRKSQYQTRFDDIEDVGDFFSYLGGIAGESAPQLAAGIAGGIAGALAAPVVGTGAAVAGIAGATAANLPFFYGMNRERQKEAVEQGLRTEVSEGAAFLTALPQALLDGIADRLLIGGAGALGITQKALTGGGVFTRGTKGIGTGAIVEAPTEVGQQMLERAQAGLSLDSDEALAEYREAAIAGGLLGSAVRGTTGALNIGTEPEGDPTPGPETTVPPAAQGLGSLVDPTDEQVFTQMRESELAREGAELRRLAQLDAEAEADVTAREAATEEERAAVDAVTEGTPTEIEREAAIRAGEEQGAVTTTTIDGETTTEVKSIDELRDTVETTDEAVTETRPLADTDFDDFGFGKRAAVRKRLIGKDLNDKAVQDDLRESAGKLRKNKAQTLDAIGRKIKETEVEKTESDVFVDEDLKKKEEKITRLQEDVAAQADRVQTVAAEADTRRGADAEQKMSFLAENKIPKSETLKGLEQQKKDKEREIRDIEDSMPDREGVKARVQAIMMQDAGAQPDPTLTNEQQKQEFNVALKKATDVVKAEQRGLERELGVANNELIDINRRISLETETLLAESDDRAIRGPERRVATEVRKREIADEITELEAIKKPNKNQKKRLTQLKKDQEAIGKPEKRTVTRGGKKEEVKVTEKEDVARRELDEGLEEVQTEAKQDFTGVASKFEDAPNITKEQDTTIAKFATGDKPKDKKALAAYRYFNKDMSIKDALYMIIYDVHELQRDGASSRSARKADYVSEEVFKDLQFTGGDNAANAFEWAMENVDGFADQAVETLTALNAERGVLSAEEVSRVAGDIDALMDINNYALNVASAGYSRNVDLYDPRESGRYVSNSKVSELLADLPADERPTAAQIRDMRDKERQAEKEAMSLPVDSQINLDIPMHPVAKKLMREKDLAGALNALSITSNNKRIKQLAKEFGKRVGTTKIKVVKNLKNKEGVPAAGLFDPETNTISIDSEKGLNTHVLLHEMGHALTAAQVANPKSGLAKRLNTLFNDVKGELSTARGAANLDEFIAESQANPEFRSELARITVRGENALRRFINIISDFYNRIIGRPSDALSRADRLIQGIIAPAPETRNSGELLMAVNQGQGVKFTREYGKDVVGQVKQIRDDTFTDGVKGLFGLGKNAAKYVGLASVNSFALGDVGKALGIGDGAMRIHEALQRQNARINNADKVLDGTLKSVEEKLKKIGKEKTITFNKIVHEATFNEVDPSLTKQEAEKKYENKNVAGTSTKKIDFWQQMQDDWNSLEREGKDAYLQLKNTYNTLFENLLDQLGKRIINVAGDNPSSRKTRNELFEILRKNRIEPYFPLVREGDFWLRYEINTGTEAQPNMEIVVESFDSKAARDRYAFKLQNATLEKDGFTVPTESIKDHGSLDSIGFENAPPTSYVSNIIDTLNKNIPKVAGVDKNQVINEIVQQFISSVPESSILKAFKNRENVLGFQQDAVRAFQIRAYGMARRTANIQSSEDIRQQQQYAKEQITKWAKEGELGENRLENGRLLDNELDARIKEALSPSNSFIDQTAKTANRLAFIGTMGFNVASALVNGAQVPVVVTPYLAANTSFDTALSAVKTATRFFSGSGLDHEVPMYNPDGSVSNIKVSGMPSIDNYYAADENGTLILRDDKDIPDLDKAYYSLPIGKGKFKTYTKREFLTMLRPVVQAASDHSLLNRSLWADTLGIELGGKTKGGKLTGMWEKFNLWGALPFHTVERANRQVTIVASFLNELARLNTKPNAAKGENNLTEGQMQAQALGDALSQTEQMNGSVSLSTAPRIAQSGIGRVAMMFRTYGVSMYYHQFKMARAALKQAKENGLDDYSIQQARRQFVASQVAVAALSGVQGITAIGLLQAMADLFLLDDDEEDADTVTRKFLGDPLYKGGIQYLTAFAGSELDISSRIGLAHLILGSNKYDFGESGKEEFVNLLGGPALGTLSSVFRGMEDILARGEIQRGVESMMPAALRNLMQSARFATEGARTRRGDLIADDLNFGDLAGKALGFSPARYTNAQERNQDLKRISRTIDEERTRLLKKYYIATRLGDDMSDAIKDIDDFNRRHAGKGAKVRITPETIRKSMKQHARTSVDMYNGVVLSPVLKQYLLSLERELDAGPYYLR